MSTGTARPHSPSPRRGYTAEQVRTAEAPLLAAGEPLMRRAAAALADEVAGLLSAASDRRVIPPASTDADAAATPGASGITRGAVGVTDGASRPLVVVLAGSGDNGGDALFAGAHLAERGADVRIVAVGPRLHEEGAAAAHRAGATDLEPDADPAAFAAAIDAADILVDGILGIGAAASPALRGRARDVVARVLERLAERGHAEKPAGMRHPLVVAVDLPSGISPDDGRVPDPTVLPADVTVTMGAVKAGLLLPPASRLAGRVVLVDLGLGPGLAGAEPAVTV